ncbi:MAG: DUF4116 domain-containing protein [Spirochaetales bacterium]|nr:DUF4116 domain-containing protein [Spirochaetales bacterium]
METIEKYRDCKKEEVIRKVPDNLWYDWLEQASEEDRADEIFMKKIILRRGECLKFAPASLKSDRDTVLKIVKCSPSAFVYASDELQNDRKFVKQAVNMNAEVIRFVSDRFKNDKGLALLAVRNNREIFSSLTEEMQSDADVAEAWLGGKPFKLKNAPEIIRDNKAFAIRTLSMYGSFLKDASEHLRADKEVVIAAVGSAWDALGFACETLRSDRDIVLAAVRHDGYALQFASDKLKDDKEIVLTAIETYEGDVLEYASERLRDDKETVMTAVKRCEYSIGFASERLRHDGDVIRTVLDAYPGQFENLPDDVQEDLDYILFGLESVVRHLPDPNNYSFFEDSTSEYYSDFAQAEEDFLDIFESIPSGLLQDDTDLSDRVSRLAIELNNAYYKEANYPYEDVHDDLIRRMESLYEEYDIPIRPILKYAIESLHKESKEKKDDKYKDLDSEERCFYENLDNYEKIVCKSAAKFGTESEKEYLSPDGGFVKNCITSFVKALVYSQNGLYRDSELWENDNYEVDLNKVYDEIRSLLPPKIKTVRKTCEFYYSDNITVDVTDDIHLILVRAVSPKIINIRVNRADSEHEHDKWLAPNRLGEFCDMVKHISDICGKYTEIAQRRAAELRDRFGL